MSGTAATPDAEAHEELSYEALVRLHSSHQQASKRYLPQLCGNSGVLVVLQLSDTETTDVAVVSLCDAMKANTACTEVDLRRNCISTEGCHALGAMLILNTSLRALKLGGNHIGDEGALLLLSALESNCSVTGIDLGATWLVSTSLMAAAIAVQLNVRPPSLKKTLLDIRANNLTLIDQSRDVENRDLLPGTRTT